MYEALGELRNELTARKWNLLRRSTGLLPKELLVLSLAEVKVVEGAIWVLDSEVEAERGRWPHRPGTITSSTGVTRGEG